MGKMPLDKSKLLMRKNFIMSMTVTVLFAYHMIRLNRVESEVVQKYLSVYSMDQLKQMHSMGGAYG